MRDDSPQPRDSPHQPPPRKIVHVDMDAFYASVEQRDRPELRGRPVVVGGSGERSVVCAASYEARRFGIRSAMPGVRAARLCPDAVFLRPDFARYKEVSQAVRAIFQRHTDHIEPLSLDEAYLDVTENKTGLATATAVARVIREQIRTELHLTASAGVAPNKFLAKIASDFRKPDGLFVVHPQHAVRFLSNLPIGRIPGVGKVTEQHLLQHGIRTVGDVQALSLAELEHRFGRFSTRLHALSRGEDFSPVVSNRIRKQVSAEDTFPADLPLHETEPTLRRLADKVWHASRANARGARTVVLKLKTKEFISLTRSLTPAAMPTSAGELADAALSLFPRVGLPATQLYRLVGIGLANFQTDTEPPLFPPSPEPSHDPAPPPLLTSQVLSPEF